MDSIRVLINDTEVGYYKIEDTGVSFTWQAKLIDEINSFSTTTTKTITLPLTKTLDTILKSPAVIDTTNSVSNREYFAINIYWNDTVSISGWIKLQRVVILENDEYVEFTIEPREKNWITQFKDFNLTQLDFTQSPNQNHALTYANIITSETPLLATMEYVYAPIDIAEVGRLQVLWVIQTTVGTATDTDFYYFGEQITSPSSTFIATTYGFSETQLVRYDLELTEVADVFWNGREIYKARATSILPTNIYGQYGYMFVQNTPYWQVSDFSPSVRHSAILRRCFERIGYGMTIVDSSSYFNDKYNFLHNVEQINKFESERNKLKVKVQAGGFSFTKSADHTWVVPFRNLTDTGLIPNFIKFNDTDSNNSALINTLSNFSRYTVNEDCVLGFKWNFGVIFSANGGSTTNFKEIPILFHIYQYDSSGILRRTVTYKPEVSFSGLVNIYFEYIGTLDTGRFYMASGDYVECRIEYDDDWELSALTPPPLGWIATIKILDTNTFETIYYNGGNYKNKTIRLNEYLPDVPAYDYIKDLSFINNWEFYTNEKLKQVYIVREDNKQTGEQIDFKQKLNRAKEVELSEVGLLHPYKYYFNWLKDDNDWCVKVVENNIRQGLGDTYDKEEIEMIARFAVGVIQNLNLFNKDKQELTCNIYAASLDKFEQNNQIKFNTVEMKGEETWGHIPTWKRIDYEPRYLRIIFGQTVETNGIGGATNTIVYSIEGNPTHTTYPRVEFQKALHFGDTVGLLETKYAKRKRAIRYGWILKGYFNIGESDVNSFVETYVDNKFRGDYELQVKGVKKIGELLKVNNFSPATFDQTEIEFVIYRDDL